MIPSSVYSLEGSRSRSRRRQDRTGLRIYNREKYIKGGSIRSDNVRKGMARHDKIIEGIIKEKKRKYGREGKMYKFLYFRRYETSIRISHTYCSCNFSCARNLKVRRC